MVSMKLLALAEREFKGQRKAPAAPAFKAVNINPGRFDSRWDRRRGTAARMTAVILRDDSDALRRRVEESPESSRTYHTAVGWLRGEAEHLRKTADLHEQAAKRLDAVLESAN